MFVYENGNTLNLVFKGQLPVKTPDIVIKGYEDGATLTVGGTVYGTGSKDFAKKANTLVYQRDNKLAITFHGVEGMSTPDITLDEVSDDVIDAVVSDTAVKLTFTESGVVVDSEEVVDPEVEENEPELVPEDPTEGSDNSDGPTYDLPTVEEEEEE